LHLFYVARSNVEVFDPGRINPVRSNPGIRGIDIGGNTKYGVFCLVITIIKNLLNTKKHNKSPVLAKMSCYFENPVDSKFGLQKNSSWNI